MGVSEKGLNMAAAICDDFDSNNWKNYNMRFKKIITLFFSIMILITSESIASDECFEKTSRAIFKFNMGFDKAILEPIAKGYNKLPEPIKNGTSNFTSNIATLLSIPNHVLQGNLKGAGDATASFLINTTLGIIGFGRIGQEVAKIAIGVGMKVLFSDKFISEQEIEIKYFDNQKLNFKLNSTKIDVLLTIFNCFSD